MMSDRSGAGRLRNPRRHNDVRTALVLVGASLCILLAGCAPHSFSVMATSIPGKFDASTCKQLPNLMKANAADIKRIEEAMSKASTAAEGAAINFAVYSPRLSQLQADRTFLAEAFAEKKCEAEASPALSRPPLR